MRATRSIGIRTALAIIIIMSGLAGVFYKNAQAAPAKLPAHVLENQAGVVGLTATVRLEHQWYFQRGSQTIQSTAYSLGTVIGPRTILTHNHFASNTGKLDDERMLLTDSDGDVTELPLADLTLDPIDTGTMLFGLPDDLTVPTVSIADRATVNRLAVGDWLTVVYWDDPNQRVAYQDFKIIKVATGIAILADPEWIINSGDSGGGAYLAGKLVGNTWRITTDENDRPLGRFTIALVPQQVVE